MTLLTLVAILIVVGVLLWALSVLPLDEQIRNIIRVVVVVAVVLWLVAGLLGETHWNPVLWR